MALAGLAMMLAFPGAQAAQVHVRPVILDIQAPAMTGNLTFRNLGKDRVTAQVRVFRWTQRKGRDVLEPTREVVASPPMLRLSPRRENVVRVVRTKKSAVRGEEAYRVIVDEIPDRRKQQGGVVFAVRYSIPVFFRAQNATPPRLRWLAKRRGGRLIIAATNSGDRHARLTDLRVSTTGGQTLKTFRGLAGYVLGHSTRAWIVPAKSAVSAVIIRGKGPNGAFRQKVRVR
jgi:fimbrial chaperone protein